MPNGFVADSVLYRPGCYTANCSCGNCPPSLLLYMELLMNYSFILDLCVDSSSALLSYSLFLIATTWFSDSFSFFTCITFFLFLLSCCFWSLIKLPSFICFSIKFLAYAKEPTNFSRSSFFIWWTLWWCRTLTLLRYFSLYYNSIYLSHNSFLRPFSSLFRCKNTWILRSSSAFCSFFMIFFISLCFVTSCFFSAITKLFSLFTSCFTSSFSSLNS